MSTRGVTPAGDSPTAPGGAEVGPLGMPGGRADEGAGLPPAALGLGGLGARREHPATANKPVVTTTVAHRQNPSPQKCTVPIYATLAAVIEPFGFNECCRA